jgi:AAA domain
MAEAPVLAFNDRPIPLTELAQWHPVPRPEIVPELLLEGEMLGLCGRPKIGKTRLGWQLGLAIAEGRPFLGKTISKARRVLFLDLETPADMLYERLKKFAGGDIASISNSNNIFFYCPENLAASRVGLIGDAFDNLREFVRSVKPDVLFIDNYRLLSGGSKENEAGEVVEDFKKISSLKGVNADKNLAIVLVHHLRKMGTNESRVTLKENPHQWLEAVSGSSAFIAHLETTLGLEKDGDNIYTLAGIRRNGPEPLLCLESSPDNLKFDLLQDRNVLATNIFTKTERELWKRLPEEFKWAEAMTIADNRKTVLHRTLHKAEDHQMIEKCQRTKIYRKLISPQIQ